MSGINLFTPKSAGTVSVTATASSTRTALDLDGNNQVRVKNVDTTNLAFIEFGDSTVVAVATSGVPIGPGETAGFSVSPSAVTHAAAVSTGATVYFTPGNGV